MKNTLTHTVNYENTIFTKKKIKNCGMTSVNLGKTFDIAVWWGGGGGWLGAIDPPPPLSALPFLYITKILICY